MSADGYLPPGCSYSDLPGYNDIDIAMWFWCDKCEADFEDSVTVDSRGGDAEGVCPDCGETAVKEYDPKREWAEEQAYWRDMLGDD